MRSGVDVRKRSVKSREPSGGLQKLQIEVPKELLPSELREYLGLREFLLFHGCEDSFDERESETEFWSSTIHKVSAMAGGSSEVALPAREPLLFKALAVESLCRFVGI